MRSFGLIGAVLLLAACDGAGKSNDTSSGLDAGAACDISPAACDEDGDGYKPSEDDCDDSDSSVNPGEVETCNGRDDNCDGAVDEGVGSAWSQDFDEDGYGNTAAAQIACEQPDGYVAIDGDCDDAQPRSFPGNVEVCDDIDNNCDGAVDEGVTTNFYADSDADNYGDATSLVQVCEAPVGYVTDNTDCDDSTSRAYPGNAEVCDTIDNDCDGRVDEGVTTLYYADVDGDGYGDILVPDDACSLPTGYSENALDCDDLAAAVNPAATELCNAIDDNCDGVIDEASAADALTWYVDADADTYGSVSASVVQCYQPAGYVLDATDCDDGRFETNPGATEFCNGFDDNCDTRTDEDSAADALSWYADTDADAFGDVGALDVECYQPAGYVADSTDCDDRDATSFPGGIEVCDGADNDCNGLVDDAPTDGTTFYADDDTDGFGDPLDWVSECALPSGYVDNDYDCNDTNGSEPVVADAIYGSSAGTGTLAAPYSSLQDAIDDASECVVALEGTYSESIDLSGKSIDVWGVMGAEYTAIDPSLSVCSTSNPTACAAAVEISSGSGAAPTLHGFTIEGGTGSATSAVTTETCADSSSSHGGSNSCSVTTYTYCGGGIAISGDDPILEDVIVYNNELPLADQASTGDYTQVWLSSYGGGICVVDGNVSLDNVWVINNYADAGGGIFVSGSAILSVAHTQISENDASDGGGLFVSEAAINLTNSVLACNSATTDGGGIFTESSANIDGENIVVYGNESAITGTARGADLWLASATGFQWINSIVENDIATSMVYGTGSATLQYNNVYNDNYSGSTYGGALAAGSGSISMGGNFVRSACDGNARNDDWTLDATSGALDAGNPAAAYSDVDGTDNDMGAYGGPGGSW